MTVRTQRRAEVFKCCRILGAFHSGGVTKEKEAHSQDIKPSFSCVNLKTSSSPLLAPLSFFCGAPVMPHWEHGPNGARRPFLQPGWTSPRFVSRLACRHWQRFVAAWDVISSSSELHMCDLGCVRHINLNACDWNHDVGDWNCIAKCPKLRCFDCAVWWNWNGSGNEAELALASEALRDKTIDTLTIGDANELTSAKESFLRNLTSVGKLCLGVRGDSRKAVCCVFACFPALASITIDCSYLGHVSLPAEVGMYRNVCIGCFL